MFKVRHLLVLAIMLPLGMPSAFAAAGGQGVPGIVGPPEVYVGTDCSFIILPSGNEVVGLILRTASHDVAVPLTGPGVDAQSAYLARIPGNWLTRPGLATLVLLGRDAQGNPIERLRQTILIKTPPASAMLADSQLGASGWS